MLSEISQSEKDKNHMISLIMWNFRNKTNEQKGKKENLRNKTNERRKKRRAGEPQAKLL